MWRQIWKNWTWTVLFSQLIFTTNSLKIKVIFNSILFRSLTMKGIFTESFWNSSPPCTYRVRATKYNVRKVLQSFCNVFQIQIQIFISQTTAQQWQHNYESDMYGYFKNIKLLFTLLNVVGEGCSWGRGDHRGKNLCFRVGPAWHNCHVSSGPSRCEYE